jgi:hypothetical protein
MRWQRHRWGYTWVFGLRRGEWWIGARRNFAADAIEINLFGITLMIGRG